MLHTEQKQQATYLIRHELPGQTSAQPPIYEQVDFHYNMDLQCRSWTFEV